MIFDQRSGLPQIAERTAVVSAKTAGDRIIQVIGA